MGVVHGRREVGEVGEGLRVVVGLLVMLLVEIELEGGSVGAVLGVGVGVAGLPWFGGSREGDVEVVGGEGSLRLGEGEG